MNLQTETLDYAVGAATIGGEFHNKQKWQKGNKHLATTRRWMIYDSS
jgi:hypothetical protein